jgi:DNA-binding GntR family transcriptional regulator
MHERAGRITAAHEKIGLALLRRLGTDGRLDPSHATLAEDTGRAPSTVKRALARLKACGLVSWALRIVRAGNRVVQTSNGYLVTLGSAPAFPEDRCKARTGHQTRQIEIPLPPASPAEVAAAQDALAQRRAAIEARLMGKV